MKSPSIKAVLDESFNDLGDFALRYMGEKKRYAYTIGLVDKLPKESVRRVLDIGCGVGIVPLTLKKMGYSAEGLEYYIFPKNKKGEFSTKAFEDADSLKKKWRELSLAIHEDDVLRDNLNHLGKFDLVISEALIEHLKDPRTFLERVNSLLENDGYLILTTPNQTKLINRLRFLFGQSVYWPISEFYSDGETFIGHWREYTMNELQQIVEKSGFEVIETHNVNLLSPIKKWTAWRKNLRAFIRNLSVLFPGTRDMNYLLGRKNTTSVLSR